jgi:hypothetical protein
VADIRDYLKRKKKERKKGKKAPQAPATKYWPRAPVKKKG